jgi:hypothetical protein
MCKFSGTFSPEDAVRRIRGQSKCGIILPQWAVGETDGGAVSDKRSPAKQLAQS